jgi:hypothetical protein
LGRLKEKCEMIFGKRLLRNNWSEITQKCVFFKIIKKRFLLKERVSAKNKKKRKALFVEILNELE